MKERFMRSGCLLLALLCLSGCAVPQPEPTAPETSTTGTFLPLETSAPTVSETEEPVPTEPKTVVSTFPQLQQLCQGEDLKSGDAVVIAGDMEICEPVIFPVPLELEIMAELVFSAPIWVKTRETGTVTIEVSDKVTQSWLDIRLDVPNCHVLWNAHPYASEEEAAVQVNCASFNGVDLHQKYGLGGTGTERIAEFAAEIGDTPLIWTVDGYLLHCAVSYLTGDDVLENAKVQITTESGETITDHLDLSPGATWYTLTDSQGNGQTYRIITQRITYNLPVFYIEVEDDQEITSKETYLSATLRIDTATAAGDFPAMDTTQIQIRGRGHYSWTLEKKPYKIRFDKKTSVLGANASKNWVLLANHTDRSLIQNYLALEMGKVMTNIPYHSTQYPVDVFINGVYRGVYTFGEQLEAKPERIDLEENYESPNTDYLLEVGGYDEGTEYGRDYFHAGTLRYIAIKHPDTAKLTQPQLDYLISYVQKADRAVRELANYEDYIDVDSLIDWVILHELSYNLDCCFRRSCYLIKEKDGKLKMGPVWDFDLAFGSFFRYEEGDWATVGESGGYVGITWMNYLKDDPAFMTRFANRWNEVKETLLSTALNCVDTMSSLVTPSAEMNFEVWDILGKKHSAQPASHNQYDTYEKMVARLRAFLLDRYAWMDAELN